MEHVQYDICEKCNGTGRFDGCRCPDCEGTGRGAAVPDLLSVDDSNLLTPEE